MDKKLRTQKDGRLFAIDVIKRINGPARRSEFSAVETEESDDGPYIFPPLNPMIRDAFDRIYQADEAVKAGFFVVMSEFIAGSVVGRLADGTLERWETEGRMREFPESAV